MHQLDNLQIDYDVEIPILVENSCSELKHYPCNRSYHAYMDTRTPTIGDDNLLSKQEKNNKSDENAVIVLQCNFSGPRVVGHISFCYLC